MGLLVPIHPRSAQPTEASITQVTRIASMLAGTPLPFAHRKRLPKLGKLAERTHPVGDQIVTAATFSCILAGRASEARGTPIRLDRQSIHN